MTPSPIDYHHSVLIAAAVGAEPLRCWRNAALAVLAFPSLFTLGTYVEGWIVVPRTHLIEIVEHGWTVAPEVGIIDPSIVLAEKRDQPVTYYPGFTLSRSRLLQLLPGNTVPLVCNAKYGRDGMGHPEYHQSYEKAWKEAHQLADESHLPSNAIKISRRDTKRGATIVTRW